MSVVVVGPTVINGPRPVDADLATAALECLDDPLALIDDTAMPADEVWRDVVGRAVGGACARIVLIHPSWWAPPRVERVLAAARHWAPEVIARRRSELSITGTATVEVAPELVLVVAGGRRQAIARAGPTRDVVTAVVAGLTGLLRVTVDVPTGAGPLGAEIAQELRRRGVEVTVGDDATLLRAARPAPATPRTTRSWRVPPRAAAVAVSVASVTALTALAFGTGDEGPAIGEVTWLVEGRVAVEVPARWTVERITGGPGSARVQIISPEDRLTAVHVTQSRVPMAQTLEAAAESLRGALAGEPEGVFVDFAAAGERAERAAITYREVRADRHVEWTVVLDGGVRIAIGCQGAAPDSDPAQVCDRAVRSAHAVAPN